jgi:hypothetical protein
MGWFKKLINRIGLWLVNCTENVVELNLPMLTPLEIRAKELCLEQDVISAPGTSGEYKRHNVISRLMKEFPQISKREISLAIEKGLPE